jgi:hypothetical protein
LILLKKRHVARLSATRRRVPALMILTRQKTAIDQSEEAIRSSWQA